MEMIRRGILMERLMETKGLGKRKRKGLYEKGIR
jgi:hypothetical protein